MCYFMDPLYRICPFIKRIVLKAVIGEKKMNCFWKNTIYIYCYCLVLTKEDNIQINKFAYFVDY